MGGRPKSLAKRVQWILHNAFYRLEVACNSYALCGKIFWRPQVVVATGLRSGIDRPEGATFSQPWATPRVRERTQTSRVGPTGQSFSETRRERLARWADTPFVRQLAPLGVAQGWEKGWAFGPFAGNYPLLLIAKFGCQKYLPHTGRNTRKNTAGQASSGTRTLENQLFQRAVSCVGLLGFVGKGHLSS